MGIVLLIIGGVLFLIGVGLMIAGLPAMRRRRRIIQTPTSAIAQAPGTGPVEIKGRVLASEQGLVQAPFSHRGGVWVRVVVQEWRQTGRSGYWRNVVNETDGRPFLVDDGSGQAARVLPAGANFVLDTQQVARSGTFKDPPPEVQAFLASRGLKSTSWLGFNKNMRYEEQVLGPGDNLYAIGPSRRDAGPPQSDGYRMVPGTQLVLFAAQGPVGELIVTNKTEEQLVSKLLWSFLGGAVAGGVGLAVTIAGAVVQVFDLAN